jgi:hypothetical protein
MSTTSELTQQSGSLTHLASELGQARQKLRLYGTFVSSLHHTLLLQHSKQTIIQLPRMEKRLRRAKTVEQQRRSLPVAGRMRFIQQTRRVLQLLPLWGHDRGGQRYQNIKLPSMRRMGSSLQVPTAPMETWLSLPCALTIFTLPLAAFFCNCI